MNTKLLKQKILDLAVQGKLVTQISKEGTGSDLLENIFTEKSFLLKNEKIKKDKKLKAIQPEDEPYKIPESWTFCKLGEIAFVTKLAGFEYSSDIAPNLVDKGVPLFKGKNIKDSKIIYEFESFIPESVSNNLLRSQINRRCLLTPYVGTIGNIGIHDREGIYHLGSNVGKIETYCPKLILDKIIFYYLKSSYGYKELTKTKKATAQESISIDAIRQVIVPIAPIAEQQRIVEQIEKIFAQIDYIEQNQTDLSTLVKQAKSKILDLAIHGKLVKQISTEESATTLLEKIRTEKEAKIKAGELKKDKKDSYIFKDNNGKYFEKFADGSIVDIEKEIPFELPEGWCWCRLGTIGKWKAGATPIKSNPEYYNNGTIPWINTGDLTDGYITNIPKMVTEQAMKECSLKLNPINSVCIAMYGATIGKLGILTFPATTNQACCVCSDMVTSNKYLFYFLSQHKTEFINEGMGGAQPNISKDKIVSTFFPLPPKEEQERIINKIENLFSLLDGIQNNLG